MPNPRETGISKITGKVVYIRHATDWDLTTLRNSSLAKGLDIDSLPASHIVVAAEGERIIAYGILEQHVAGDGGCLLVRSRRSRSSMGAVLARHIADHYPLREVSYVEARPVSKAGPLFRGHAPSLAKKSEWRKAGASH